MEYRGQSGQDKWVAEFFNQKKNGFFIDIGAYDGEWLSNTLYLEKELGWDGICIEPGELPYSKLISNRTAKCIRKFISDNVGEVSFEEFDYTRPMKKGSQLVLATRMDILLPQLNAPRLIDYVSLDVDGPEYEVLLGFPFEDYEVVLWTIETDLYRLGPGKKMKIKNIMENSGYVVAMDNVMDNNEIFEDWYINKKHAGIQGAI